jgi:hypothetical protein
MSLCKASQHPSIGREYKAKISLSSRTREYHKSSHSSLLSVGSRLALIPRDTVQHDLVGVLGVVGCVSLVPIVGDGVGEDGAVVVKVGAADAAADFGVALETVLGVLVPEVECAVAAGGAEGAMDGVE